MSAVVTSRWRKQFSRLRRVGVLIGVSLVLGAATTVAVAWWITLRWPHSQPMFGVPKVSSSEQAFGGVIPERECQVLSVWRWQMPGVVSYLSRSIEASGIQFGRSTVDTSVRSYQFVPTWAREALWIPPIGSPTKPDPRTAADWRCVRAMGWPWPAMWKMDLLENGDDGIRITSLTAWHRGDLWGRPAGAPVFPCRPVAAGFAKCTLVYAAAWMAMMLSVVMVRRWRRVATGLCRRCRYDLRGLRQGAVCPECGAS